MLNQRVTTEYPGYPPLPSWSDVTRSNASDYRRAVNGSFLPLENIQGDILFVISTFLPISWTCPFIYTPAFTPLLQRRDEETGRTFLLLPHQ